MSDVTIGSSASDEVVVVVNPAASAVVINTAKNDTLTYRNEALVAKTASETAQTAAELAETNAETAETNTLTSASNANTSANTASTHATTSTTQAGIATTQASNANASAIASASSASDSDSSATASSGSASSANISAVNALASEEAAAISESEAADSASQANVSRIATDNRWGEFNGIWLGKFITAEMPTVSVDVGSMAYDSTLNSFRTWNGLVWSEASAGDSITDVTSTRVGDTVTVKVYLEGALIESFDIVDGAQGIQGIQGIQGVQGLQGIQGIQGVAGVEAYTDAEIKTKYELNADTNAFTDNEKSLVNDGVMLSSTDLNTITSGGRYGAIGALNTNIPTAGEFALDVTSDGTRVMQIATYPSGNIYTRFLDGTWSAWDTVKITEAQIIDFGNYEPVDATILRDADIGVTVQGYDATIVVDADIGVTVQGYDILLNNTITEW